MRLIMAKTKKLTISAMFAALACVATLINIPSVDGYKNLGDCIVILSGCILGPFYGALAAGIGSALSDVILGYAFYAPATLVIKGIMALLCGSLFKKEDEKLLPVHIFAMIEAEIIMISGYFVYSLFILGNGIAAVAESVPGNVMQGAVGVIGAVILLQVFFKNKALQKLLKDCR